MRENQLSGLVVFHTHPGSDHHVEFSWYDDSEEPLLVSNLTELHPGTILVSLVVGRNGQCGRVWTRPNELNPMESLVVVGESISFAPLNGIPTPPPPQPEEIFDSAKALSGAGALAHLREMTIGLVGTSGTGSLIRELLTRAGCQHIILIDHDTAERRNANRILHLTTEDVAFRRSKVEISRRAAELAGFGCQVEAVEGNVLDRTVLAKLREADVVFGCVDAAYPRKLLSEFSFRFLRPYIDVGTEIGADKRGIVSLDARVSYIAPGRPCLMCMGVATPRQLWFESLAFQERERVARLGYCDDLLLKQPAVMDLNMRAASSGTILLRHLLQPFLLEPLPLSIMENFVVYSTRKIQKARALRPNCRVCQTNSLFGYGDCAPALGLDAPTLAYITGANSNN